MKRFLILAAAVLLAASCSTMLHERVVETYFIDYRPYAEAGFFLSPDPYPGEFDALGELLIEVTPAVVPAPPRGNGTKYIDGAYKSASAGIAREVISGAELVEMAYKKAVELGADGIADFRVKASYNWVGETKILSGYEVSGLAIKRK